VLNDNLIDFCAKIAKVIDVQNQFMNGVKTSVKMLRYMIMIKWICTYLIFASLSLSTTFCQDIEVFAEFDEFEKKYLKYDDDKVYVINFWATWCAPCVKELPHFEELNAINDDNVEVLLVTLDFERDMERRVKPLIEKKGLKSKIVMLDDPQQNRWIDLVDPSWSGTIPATLFLKNGKKTLKEQDFHSLEELENII